VIQILLVVQVLLALSIIGLVLLQRGKGADAGASLGGGGNSGSVFGARGAANFLSRTTGILAAAFFINSLGLATISANMQSVDLDNGSVLEQPAPLPATDVPSAEMPATEVPATEAPAAEVPASDIPASE